MKAGEFAILKRRMAKRDRRSRKINWFGICFGIGFQIPGIMIGFVMSWTRGLQAVSQAALVMLIWVPILLQLRKMRILSNASMIADALIRDMGESRDEDEEAPTSEDDPFDGLFVKLVIFRFGLLVWGTPEGKWRNGCSPYHSHPDDRRRRLLEMLTIAAWRDLPGMPWEVRLDMIAVAQICIAAEAVQSRSLSGRIRNALLRVFARRDRVDEVPHIVPIGNDET